MTLVPHICLSCSTSQHFHQFKRTKDSHFITRNDENSFVSEHYDLQILDEKLSLGGLLVHHHVEDDLTSPPSLNAKSSNKFYCSNQGLSVLPPVNVLITQTALTDRQNIINWSSSYNVGVKDSQ